MTGNDGNTGRGPADEGRPLAPTEHLLDEGALGDAYYEQVSQRRSNPVSRLIGRWADRLAAGAAQGSFADQSAQYASGRTRRDYAFSTLGIVLWGAFFPLLTIIATQLVGAEQAGVFSLVFVTATLLMFLGNYGVRTFQVSDVEETHSFADYQANRILTCMLMMLVGYVYCCTRGYTGDAFAMSMAVYAFRAIDALADVYEGRLQQMDKMYLAGISQALRSGASFIVFALVLLVTRMLLVASIFMTIAACASLVLVTVPLAWMETPRSRTLDWRNVIDLLKRCFALFVALFMYNLVDNMPKFMMEGVLSYDNQLYFNALYFPAHAILLIVSMVYRPLLLRLAQAWEDSQDRRRFRLILLAVFASIIVVTGGMLAFMNWVGLDILSFLYGIDFSGLRSPLNVMIVAGGISAAIDFLYQVITVQRKQNTVMKLYLITFAVSIAASLLLINLCGLMGAVAAYAVEMAVLFILITAQLAGITGRMWRNLQARRATRTSSGS